VTCEKDAGQFAGKKIYGHKGNSFDQMGLFSHELASLVGCDLDSESSGTAAPFTDQVHGSFDPNPHHGCDWRKRRAGRIVSTHNVELVNEEDSFRKHRCYTYIDHCVCECLENTDFYLDGTVQGNAANLPKDIAGVSALNEASGIFGTYEPATHRGAIDGNDVFVHKDSYFEGGTTHHGSDGLIQQDKSNFPASYANLYPV
jgi:hypothetical protein